MNENTQSNESAVAVFAQDGMVVHQAQNVTEKIMSGASGNFMTTINNDGKPATQARIFNAINDNTASIKDMVNKVLIVTDLMAFPVSLLNSQTGEMEDAIRVVLITKDGNSYGSVAKGVFSSLQSIIAICGVGPWEGLKLVPVTKKTNRGFETLVFRMEA